MGRSCKQVSILRDITQCSKIDQTISLILNLFNPHLSVFENTIDPDQLASPEVHYKKETFVQSFQPRVTVTSCFVYKITRNLDSIDHLCIDPILGIGLIHM